MHVEGLLAPDSIDAAREEYDALVPTSKTVVREVAKAMAFDREEYGERVTEDVVETARDALFASLLEVHVGTHEEFERFRESNPGLDTTVRGSEHVDNVVWHVAPTGEVVAATYQDEREAAIATLRRQAFGSVYRDAFEA
ncbi:DUF5809 family protein [Halorarius litoreus]|uniref:DUF5809 family protein n=1 Tax=Halorarius litoreus TaxID=2962676 RepID=UPI0020CF8A4B|nr:DUF5809 family protein [Halorarius litoreus]